MQDRASPLLTVLIPCYNELDTIARVVQSVRAVELGHRVEIIVIDDGSTDGSAELVGSELAALVDRHVCLDRNRGKGYAIRQGIRLATGEYTIIQDADLEYDPADYPKLCAPVFSGRADVVFGSRFTGGDAHRVLYFWHYAGNKLLTLLSNMFTNLNLTDMETGLKLFRTDILKGLELHEDRFGIEPELTARVARVKNIRIYETGIGYSGRTYAEGKKIKWTDGVHAMWVIVRCGIFR